MPFVLLSLLLSTPAPAAYEMPAQIMCDRDEFTFRSCYGATKEECLTSADAAAKECLKKVARPDVAGLPENEGRAAFGKWGMKVGHCSEQAYHEKNKAKFQAKDAKCAESLKNRLEGYQKYK